jgi:hypothetical protein
MGAYETRIFQRFGPGPLRGAGMTDSMQASAILNRRRGSAGVLARELGRRLAASSETGTGTAPEPAVPKARKWQVLRKLSQL